MLDENKNGIRGVWDILNKLSKGGTKKIIYPEYFIDNHDNNYDMNNVVNRMNKFFVNVGPELAARISDQGRDTMIGTLIKNNSHSIFLSAVDELEVKTIVRNCNIKFSTDCDDIDMALVKRVIDSISKPFTYICNLSLQTGSFPQNMKTAKVIPLFKQGNKHLYTNYRPVSLLSQFSKNPGKTF